MTFYTPTVVGRRVSSEFVEISRSVFGRLTNPDKDVKFTQNEYWDGNVYYGVGVDIDGTVWAPVNCGYHPTDYKYVSYISGVGNMVRDIVVIFMMSMDIT